MRSTLPGGIATLFVLTTLIVAGTPGEVDAQRLTYSKGQPVFPAYEGWTEKPDGSLSFMFGYMNENWEEELNIPVGPDNSFSSGPADRGQPTYFLPRRNRFVFEVPVPQDFGRDDELVWTLRANGQEFKAYATLREDYYVDNVVIMSETGALGAGTSSPAMRANEPPTIDLEIDTEIEATVGVPVELVAVVTDDGQPSEGREALRSSGEDEDDADADDDVNADVDAESAEASGGGDPDDADDADDAGTDGDSDSEADAEPTPQDLLAEALRTPTATSTVSKRLGLHFTWFPYRGPEGVDLAEVVEFDPPQTKPWEDTRPFANSPWAPAWTAPADREPSELPEDGRWMSRVIFTAPGTYELRGRADDGGLYSDVEVTVVVGEAGAG